MSLPWYAVAVDHDPEAAAAAASGLALVASAVGEALGSLEAAVPPAVEDWSGRARAVFDAEAPAVVEAGYALVTALLDAAAAVRARSEAAQDEAARRAAVAAERDAGSPALGLPSPLLLAAG